jgi:hypothetical protein
MPSININAPQAGDPVKSPFDVQGPYSLKGSEETTANVKVVVSHPNGQDYTFGPQAPNDPATYDITCNNVPSSNGQPASVTASLFGADPSKPPLDSQTTLVTIS